MLNILVCVKQVPDVNLVKIDPVTGSLIRKGVPAILNPLDANALEAAVQMGRYLWRPVQLFWHFCKKVWHSAEKVIAFLKKNSKIKIYRKKGAPPQDEEGDS